jgi:hypothetical protein
MITPESPVMRTGRRLKLHHTVNDLLERDRIVGVRDWALYEDVNKLSGKHIPLLEKEGWMRGQENIPKPPYSAQTGWSVRRKWQA